MWKMAWRNLWRNRVRTAIMMTAITLSAALGLIALGVTSDQYTKLEASALQTAGGNILIQGNGYQEEQTHELLIDEVERVRSAVAALPAVTNTVERVLITGLVSSPRGSGGVQLRGVAPEAEALIYDFRPWVTEGAMPELGEDGLIALGSGVVEALEIELGDRVVLTTTDRDGEMVRALFHLSGVVHTGLRMLDEGIAFTTVRGAQEAVGFSNELTQIGLVLRSDAERQAVRDALRSALATTGDVPALEVLAWDDAMPEMLAYIELDRVSGYFYFLVIFLVVAFGIANTFLMAVLERIRELGLLSALGMSGWRVAGLVMAETLLMTVMSIGLAYAIAFGVHVFINASQVDLAALYGEGMDFAGVALTDTTLGSTIPPLRWAVAGALFASISLLSAVYPAVRSARLNPVDAMRTFQ